MLKYTDTEVVFKEVPDEITLAINISGCPNHCLGCHSPELWEDIGDSLTEEAIEELLQKNKGISCVSLMGGDQDPIEVNRLASLIRKKYPDLMISWYSGKTKLPDLIDLHNFDYIKLGPYNMRLGGLDHKTTNQRMYRVEENLELTDITEKFWKKN